MKLILPALGAVLLFSAGTFRWLSAWIYILGSFGLNLWSNHLMQRNSPDIAVERARGPFQNGQPRSDKVVLAMMITTNVFLMIVAGMDKRFGWSDVPIWVQATGAVFMSITAYTTYRVALENRFASGVVRIQKDRGHKVVDTGPYRYVRHPMYTGLIFRVVGSPLLLGSWWGLCPASATIILVFVRILLEERVLRMGLEGYNGYIERVRYRLIPLVW